MGRDGPRWNVMDCDGYDGNVVEMMEPIAIIIFIVFRDGCDG